MMKSWTSILLAIFRNEISVIAFKTKTRESQAQSWVENFPTDRVLVDVLTWVNFQRLLILVYYELSGLLTTKLKVFESSFQEKSYGHFSEASKLRIRLRRAELKPGDHWFASTLGCAVWSIPLHYKSKLGVNLSFHSM